MDLPGDDPDGQCRYLEAAVNGVLARLDLRSEWKPLTRSQFDYKLAWLERLTAHAAELCAAGAPVVLARLQRCANRPRHLPDEVQGIATPCCSHRAARCVSAPPRAGLDRDHRALHPAAGRDRRALAMNFT